MLKKEKNFNSTELRWSLSSKLMPDATGTDFCRIVDYSIDNVMGRSRIEAETV